MISVARQIGKRHEIRLANRLNKTIPPVTRTYLADVAGGAFILAALLATPLGDNAGPLLWLVVAHP